MNKSFGILWNDVRATYIVTSELAKTSSRRKACTWRQKYILKIIALLLYAPLVLANNTGDNQSINPKYKPFARDPTRVSGYETLPVPSSEEEGGPTVEQKKAAPEELVNTEKKEDETKVADDRIKEPVVGLGQPLDASAKERSERSPVSDEEKHIEESFFELPKNKNLILKDKSIYSKSISGEGDIDIALSGNVIFTGRSKTFRGNVMVKGMLTVNGELGGEMYVEEGGYLKGTGVLGSTLVYRGGVIAPGNPIGTLTIDGELVLEDGSIFEAKIDANGQCGQIKATGQIVIGDAHLKVLGASGSYKLGTRYTLLDSEKRITGTFKNMSSNLPFVNLEFNQDSNHLYLDVIRNKTSFTEFAQKSNQKAVATTIERLGVGSGLYHLMVMASTPEEVLHASDALSGELYAASQSFFLDNSYHLKNAATSRLRTRVNQDKPGAVEGWVQGYRALGHYRSDASAELNYRQTSLLMGMDKMMNNWRVGVLGGYGSSRLGLEGPHGNSNVESYHLGLYAGRLLDRWNILLGSAYTWNKARANRDFILGNQQFSNNVNYQADTLHFFGEVGYKFEIDPTLSLEPIVGITHARLDNGGFQESGNRLTALRSNSTDRDVTFSTVGLRAKKYFVMNQTEGELEAGLAWRHAYGDTRPVSRITFSTGGDSMDIHGAAMTKDAAVTNLSAIWKVGKQAHLALNYAGLGGQANWRNSIQAKLIWNF